MTDVIYEIKTDGEFKNYTAIPNVVWELNLPSRAIHLLNYYLRVAGMGGECWQSADTVCSKTSIGSHHTITKARNELVKAGLIEVSTSISDTGHKRFHVTVNEKKLWRLNAEWAEGPTGKNANGKNAGSHRQKCREPMAKMPTKNNPVKKNTFKKKEKAEILFTAVTIPDELSGSVEFSDIWFQRIEHRIELKKPYTERAAKMTLNKLSAYGLETAIEALRAAIENDWQGVFPEKSNGGGNGRKSQAVLRKEESDNNIRNIIQSMATGD